MGLLTTVNEEEFKRNDPSSPSSPLEEHIIVRSLSESGVSSDYEENHEKTEKFNLNKYMEEELEKLLKVCLF